MSNNQAPQWPISNDDKKIIQDLGRKIHKMLLEYAKENAVNGTFHVKYMAGAFQYVEGIMGAKATLVAEDVLILQDTIEKFALGDFIVEPFQQTPTPSLESLKAEALKKKEEAEKELAQIAEVEKVNEVVPPEGAVLSPVQPSGDSPAVTA